MLHIRYDMIALPQQALARADHNLKNCPEGQSVTLFPSGFFYSAAATAAAEDNEKGDYYKPDPIIIKDIAKTVIHIRSSLNILGTFLPLGTIL